MPYIIHTPHVLRKNQVIIAIASLLYNMLDVQGLSWQVRFLVLSGRVVAGVVWWT